MGSGVRRRGQDHGPRRAQQHRNASVFDPPPAPSCSSSFLGALVKLKPFRAVSGLEGFLFHYSC
eukprot:4062861-Pyramimonas_sp.AAC.1